MSPGFEKLQEEHQAGVTANPGDHQPRNCPATHQSISQSINQSINQSVNQSISQGIFRVA